MSSEKLVKLCKSKLSILPDAIQKPPYELSTLRPGILHFGLGNFHRAHEALFVHRLLCQGEAADWAIVGAGVLPSLECSQQAALKSQDCLYTLTEQSTAHTSSSIIASIVDYITPGDSSAILNYLSQPNIRIVSLTITEGGYFLSAATGQFDLGNNDITRDVESSPPRTVFGLLVAALRLRRALGIPAFTVLSCDNIQQNGDVTKDAVVKFASLVDIDLANWIEKNVDFPNSMVDRITTVTSESNREYVREECGIADDCPVFCEDFIQWVVEDKFRSGRPRFENVGVQFVPDVGLFETMKIRILNGGHAAMAYPAGLMEIEFAHEAMESSLLVRFLDKVENEEILQIVPPVPGVDLQQYYQVVRARFANSAIKDTIRRLCSDGSNRQPKFIVSSIRACLNSRKSARGLALVSALWCRYCMGFTDSGQEIQPNDPNWKELQIASSKAKNSPLEWLKQRTIYGDLQEIDEFTKEFSGWLRMIYDKGTKATLQIYVEAKS